MPRKVSPRKQRRTELKRAVKELNAFIDKLQKRRTGNSATAVINAIKAREELLTEIRVLDEETVAPLAPPVNAAKNPDAIEFRISYVDDLAEKKKEEEEFLKNEPTDGKIN